VIEIFTKTENNHEFILEKLFRGSIINYRTFFMEEDGKVFYRFGRNSICFTLPFELFNEILNRHKELNLKFMKFQKKTVLQEKPFPLDYIMNLPKNLREKRYDRETQEKIWKMENVVKNIVIRILNQIR